jgi:hypothetical protein
MGLNKQLAPLGLVFFKNLFFYRQVVPLGLKKLHRSEMFVEK